MSTLDETAARLGTSARYVRRLVEQKRLALAPMSDATMALDPGSIDAFEQTRKSRGRPQKASTRDALACELLGASNGGISLRTLARIRRDLSSFSMTELAESLQQSSNPDLSGLAAQALSAPTYLEQKRAQKSLRDLHATWAASRWPRGRRKDQFMLMENATTSSVSASARRALRENHRDLAFRLIVDHIVSLAQRHPEEISALMTRPKGTGDLALDTLLQAGIAWAASTRDVPLPTWHQTVRLPTMWNPTGRKVVLERALPQFLEANIYFEARDVGAV